ncbi:hypothetical protein D1007_22388 [Hordeum vulgare]|nr:hypothetical protein D1007_22388 [Hordeum vulgare]
MKYGESKLQNRCLAFPSGVDISAGHQSLLSSEVSVVGLVLGAFSCAHACLLLVRAGVAPSPTSQDELQDHAKEDLVSLLVVVIVAPFWKFLTLIDGTKNVFITNPDYISPFLDKTSNGK